VYSPTGCGCELGVPSGEVLVPPPLCPGSSIGIQDVQNPIPHSYIFLPSHKQWPELFQVQMIDLMEKEGEFIFEESDDSNDDDSNNNKEDSDDSNSNNDSNDSNNTDDSDDNM